MKVLGWMAAAALSLGMVGAAPAQAQRERVVERTTTTHVRYDNDRRDDRGSERRWHHSRYRDGGWGWRTNCRTQYRHGHRERVCRKVRYRR